MVRNLLKKMTLKEHILQCELRYQALEQRLDSVERKLDEVKSTIDGFKDTIIQYAVSGFIGLIVFMAGMIFVAKI